MICKKSNTLCEYYKNDTNPYYKISSQSHHTLKLYISLANKCGLKNGYKFEDTPKQYAITDAKVQTLCGFM